MWVTSLDLELRHLATGPNSNLQRAWHSACVVQSYWACFGLYPSSCMWKTKNTTTFRRLDLSPSSLDQWLRLALSNGPNWVGLSCPIHVRTESKTSPIALYNIHHRQNPFKSNQLHLCVMWWWKQKKGARAGGTTPWKQYPWFDVSRDCKHDAWKGVDSNYDEAVCVTWPVKG
jgi:hypothetical protein